MTGRYKATRVCLSHLTQQIFLSLSSKVLALGPPYPLVVLPVEGDYWMEGTNHIQQRDRQNRPVIPKFDLSKCVVESDRTASVYRRNFLGKVSAQF